MKFPSALSRVLLLVCLYFGIRHSALELHAQPAPVLADPTTGALLRPSAANFISGQGLLTSAAAASTYASRGANTDITSTTALNSITAASGANLTLTSGVSAGNIVLGKDADDNPLNSITGSAWVKSGVADASNYTPIYWGSTRDKWALGSGVYTSNSTTSYTGGLGFNGAYIRTGGVNDGTNSRFGLLWETCYNGGADGVDTEMYYYWDGPDGATSFRPFQINTSWGVAYGAPVAKPIGWTSTTLKANRFGITSPSGAAQNLAGGPAFLVDYDVTPLLLTFGGQIIAEERITSKSTTGSLEVWSTDAPTDTKRARFYTDPSAGTFVGLFTNDAASSSEAWLGVTRTNTAPGVASIYAKTVVENTTEASAGDGALRTTGGIYATKAIRSGSTTASTSTSTGSGVFAGGIGLAGALWAGSDIVTSGNGVGFVYNNTNAATGNRRWAWISGDSGATNVLSLRAQSDNGSSQEAVIGVTRTGVAATGFSVYAATEATTAGAGSLTTAGGIYATKKIVTSSDVEVADIGEGLILKSANGTRWRLTVSDAGASVWTSL